MLLGILHSLLLHYTPSNFSSCRVLHIAGLFVLYTCVIVSQHFEVHKCFCYYGNWYLNATFYRKYVCLLRDSIKTYILLSDERRLLYFNGLLLLLIR